MVRYAAATLSLILLAAPLVHPQDESAASAPNWGLSQLDTACKTKADYSPAYAYCRLWAVYLEAAAEDEAAKEQPLTSFNSSSGTLVSAYSIRIATGMVEKAALTAAGNVLKKDIASPAASNGSTSLVAKTAQATLLGVAVESGALTQSQTGNTVTLQANLDHLFHEAFLGTPSLSYLPQGTPVLENFTVSASLAANSTNTETASTTGSATSTPVNTSTVSVNSSATKLSSISVSYEFNNPLTRKKISHYAGETLKVASDATLRKNLLLAQNALADAFSKSIMGAKGCDESDYKALKVSFFKKVGNNRAPNAEDFADFVDTFNGCFNKVSAAAEKLDPNIDVQVQAYTAAFQADMSDYQTRLKKQLSGLDFSAQYVYHKPVDQPQTHDFRFVGSGDLSKTAGAVWTVNGAVSLYSTVPSGAQYGRMKDAQFSGEIDRSLSSKSSAAAFGVAAYGQYQSKPSVLNITASSVPSGVTLPPNAQVFLSGTQGWLGVVQAKLTMHFGGAQVPIGIKWSNKTDLLDQKNKISAQFGLSYDLSNLKQFLGSAL